MKHYDSLIVLAIIVLVVIQPDALVQLNTTILGKLLILGCLIAATLYKPYINRDILPKYFKSTIFILIYIFIYII